MSVLVESGWPTDHFKGWKINSNNITKKFKLFFLDRFDRNFSKAENKLTKFWPIFRHSDHGPKYLMMGGERQENIVLFKKILGGLKFVHKNLREIILHMHKRRS